MKTVVIYGAEHHGSTYHIVEQFKNKLHAQDSCTEFFLPKDMPNFCVGCTQCFVKGEQHCPHQGYVHPIQQALREADLLIFASPVYVLGMTAQMKALFDHLAFWFIPHRPEPSMFHKTALIVVTAAGGGMRQAIQGIRSELSYWGVGKIFSYGPAVYAVDWKGVQADKKAQIEQAVKRLSKKIQNNIDHPSCQAKQRGLFYMMRILHKRGTFTEIDRAYWESQGWLGKKRPWKKT